MSFWTDNQPPQAMSSPLGAGGAPMGGGITSLAGIAAGPGVSTGAAAGTGAPSLPNINQGTAGPAGGAPAGNYGNLSDPGAWMGLIQQGPGAVGDWLAQSNPQLAQLFQSNPGLKDYYAQQIIKSPGANPTEQAGSAQYWTNKALQDPGITGGVAGGSVGGSNHGIPGLDPGFDFQVGEATKAIQRSAASKGTLLTGGTLKGLADYVGNDMASSAYQGAFGRSLSLANLGENAAAGQGANNSGYANSASNAITSGANAQGAAGIAQSNLIGGAANNIGQTYLLRNLFPNTMTPQSSYAPPSTGAYG